MQATQPIKSLLSQGHECLRVRTANHVTLSPPLPVPMCPNFKLQLYSSCTPSPASPPYLPPNPCLPLLSLHDQYLSLNRTQIRPSSPSNPHGQSLVDQPTSSTDVAGMRRIERPLLYTARIVHGSLPPDLVTI